MLSILSVFYYNNHNKQPRPKQIKAIEKWFWITGFTTRYSGTKQRDNQINDANEMKKLALKRNYKFNLEGKTEIGVLSIGKLSKIKYNRRGALRNTFFCYLLSKSPLQFTNAEQIYISDISSIFNAKNDHHIFPKKLLQTWGYKLEEINRIINICFLTFGENVRIQDKEPWKYLKEYKDESAFKTILKSHILPFDSCLLKKGNVEVKFERFIKLRTEMIKEDLKKIIGEKYLTD